MSTADCDFLGISGQPVIGMDENTVLILQAKLSQLMWEILHSRTSCFITIKTLLTVIP